MTTLPCNETGDSGIRPSNTQESAKVLCTARGIGDVDTKTDGAAKMSGKKERPAQPQLVRKVSKQQ